ncbi:DUF4123 domain-containing protein [Enterobacteriaceae bacterium BIT-l23]|uniref:DUF4123 domain-containing protein n=1 Tax=Jejubacter sp. L23 TaxID=3092086 RepID=UPI00158455A8|nr:DUF4123 domain-containing protein [Enterobacteriaceae bacterium BIT-l23]
MSFSDIKKSVSDSVFGDSEKIFLLIDPTLESYQSVQDFYQLVTDDDIHRVAFSHPELDGALELWLIPLDKNSAQNMRLFDASIECALNEINPDNIRSGKGRSICSWISTKLTIGQLSEYISRLAVQKVKGKGDVLMRFFDPAVFSFLFIILDTWQRQQILNNIDAWGYIDGDGRPQVMSGGGESHQKLNYSLGLTPLDLSNLGYISRMNKILLRYRTLIGGAEITEQQAAELLYPALHYFSDNYYLGDDGYIDFGINVLVKRERFPSYFKREREISRSLNETLPRYKTME